MSQPDPETEASDEGTRSFLEHLLELRRNSRDGRSIDPIMAASLTHLAVRVFSDLIRPLADVLKVKLDPADYEDQPIEALRLKIADALTYGFPLPDGVSTYLANALEALNAGYTDEIFQERAGRRGVAPHIVLETKLKLLMWIRHQHGREKKIAEATAEVAEKVGRTYEAIAKWNGEVASVYGKEKVQSLLKYATLIGRSEAKSGTHTSDAADESCLEWVEAQCMLDRDLEALADVFRIATTMRKESPPEKAR